MIDGKIRVHEIQTGRPLDLKNIAQLIAHNLRKGNIHHDNTRKVQRTA